MPSNNDGRVIINIDSNASKTQREFEALDITTSKYNQTLKNTQNTANSSKSALSAYGNQLKANKTSASGLSGALGTLGGSLGSLGTLASGAAAGFALLKLKDYGQYALQTSAAFEQLAVSFRVMTGSAQLGQELTDAIIELGAKTPMTVQQLSKAAQLLLSFGESAENIIPDLQLLGDITGGEVNRFNQLALAFAQVGANAKLMGQDQLQMVNAGFNPLQAIAEKTGRSMNELRAEMAEGRISFQMVRQAMEDATKEGGRFNGLLEEQAKTLSGRLSTLGDTWERVSKAIGDIFAPAAKAGVEALISLGEATENTIKWLQSEESTLVGLKKAWDKYWASKRKSEASLVFNFEPYLKQQRAQKQVQSVLNKSGAKTGFNANFGSSNSTQKGKSEKVKGAYAQLQEAASQAQQQLQNLAAQGITSGKVWDSQVAKVNNLTAALDRVKQATDLSVIPPFQALNTEIQKAQERVNNLAASKIVNLQELKEAKSELTGLQKELQKVQDLASTSPFQQKQNALSNIQSQYLDLAILGEGNSPAAIQLKNLANQYRNEIEKAQTSLQSSVGLSWKNISNTISSQLSYALTTPLQEGENAFERLGNVALNVIGQIAQAWLSNSLNNLFSGSGGGGKSSAGGLLGTIGGLAGSFFGPAGSAIGGFFGNTIGKLFNANGNAFVNGHLQPFANGGVVSSPTMFPMSGNRTGIMGERGAEAIMPLKRTPSGQLGVQAQVQQPNINIYNQSGANIETVQRPDGDMDIFIRKVNNALRNERTQSGFNSALQRNNSKGVQAA